jgi:hypothetical protein
MIVELHLKKKRKKKKEKDRILIRMEEYVIITKEALHYLYYYKSMTFHAVSLYNGPVIF